MLIRTDSTVRDDMLGKIASQIDSARDCTAVNLIFLQKMHDLTKAYIDCVKKDAVKDIMRECQEKGYDEEAMPSCDIILKEGQQV